MKKLFILFLTLFVASSVGVYAYTFQQDGIYYEIIGDESVRVDHSGEPGSYGPAPSYSGKVTIPETVTYQGKTYRVTGIVEQAFWKCEGLTSVTMPNSVTTIGDGAFGYCEDLTSVTISNGVTTIGWNVFCGCSGLTSVTIPESVTAIGENAFYLCTGLTSIIIPNSVTEIGDWAFGYCSGLTSVTIPESVITIGKCAFSCSYLTFVKISENVTTIGDEAFNTTKHILYNGYVSGVPWSAKTRYYYDGDYAYSDANKTKFCFYAGTSGDVVIPDGATSIVENAFADATNITSVTIPESVNTIEANAFKGCTGLTSVIISKNVSSISSSAFSGCTNLSKVYFNAENCAKTTAFNNMGSIKEVSFGNSVTTIPEGLFSGCTSINSVTISNSVTTIPQGLFSGCSAIGSVTIPNSVVTIEASAFENCTKLKELTIGANCNSIGENAFGGCSRLVDVRCMAEDVPLASQSSFANYNGYLYVPCEYVRWYKADNIFGQFANTECIPSNDSELQSDDVAVVPEINNALFTMPRNNDANSYTLTIQNNGVTFCTLTFNENGQLSNIDFSTNKSYELKAGVSAFQFTVTGLSTSADYGYSFKALASNKSVLKEYTGSFTTKNADGTGGSSSSDNGGQGGGQGGQGGSTAINGVSNATTVAIVNNQILVNGEAPAFVVTVSGKKIANQNLKSGVYFVVVDGETVKVSVQ